MKRRELFIVGVLVAAVLLVGGLVLANRHTDQPRVTPQYWKQAKATSADATCLKTNPKITISKSEKQSLELSAIGYFIDVPAGTNVDVKLASYSATHVTGTDYYPSKYGNYNFAMTKQSDGWHVTDFNRCHS